MKSSSTNKQVLSNKHAQLLNEIWSAITHGIGFILSIIGTILLLTKAIRLGKPLDLVAYAIYGGSLLVLFFSSTMFHSLYFTRASHVFQIFDHSSINLLIAGSSNQMELFLKKLTNVVSFSIYVKFLAK